jgi:hypothetical protein
MNSILSKEVRRRFEQQFRNEFPNFRRKSGEVLPPGTHLYERRVDECGLSLFLVLLLSPKDDRFTIELGWGKGGVFPQNIQIGPEKATDSGVSFRLASLWLGAGRDHWWWLGRERTLEEIGAGISDGTLEEKAARIDSQVTDAVQRLKELALPYFENVLSEKRCSVTSV